MGNNTTKSTASSKINSNIESAFTLQEKASLRDIYQKLVIFISQNNLSNQTNEINIETLSSAPTTTTVPTSSTTITGKDTFSFPSKVLLDCLIQNQILNDYNTFQEFIESQTRSNKTILIRSIWKIVINMSSNTRNNVDAVSGETNHLEIFFQIILQLLSLDEMNVHQHAAHLAQTVMLTSSASSSSSSSSYESSTKTNNSFITKLEILENYIRKYAPCLPSIFETFFNFFCFHELNSTSPLGWYNPPHFLSKSDVIQHVGDILPLSFYSSNLQGNWKKLYTSTTDGLSFNRIAHHVLGYDGPTCLLIHCETVKKIYNSNNSSNVITANSSMNSFSPSLSTTTISPTHRYHHIIGAFSQDSFKDSNRCHGSSNNCLFALAHEGHPVKIIRSRDSSAGAYQWLNTNTYSCPHGLGFGGSSDKGDLEEFRLFITDSLENCFVRSNCLTYESGDLLPTQCCDEKMNNINNSNINHNNNSTNDNSNNNTSSTSSSSSSLSSIGINNPSINIGRSDMKYFDILTLEIWGCGGTEAVNKGILAQQAARKDKDYVIQKARQVDKAQFFSNPFDREYLLGITTASNNPSSNAMDTDYAHAMEKEYSR